MMNLTASANLGGQATNGVAGGHSISLENNALQTNSGYPCTTSTGNARQ